MKRWIALTSTLSLAAALVWPQSPASTAQKELKPVEVNPQQQAILNDAWKELQIAQLQLQLAVQQALNQMEKGTYYDYQTKQFYLRPAPAPVKPAEPAKKP